MASKINEDIIFFGPTDWWGMNPSSGTHIARKLSLTNRVLYVNTISADFAGTVSKTGISSHLLNKILRRIKSLARTVKKVNEGLYVCSPLFIPIQGNKVVDTVNNVSIAIQLKMITTLLNMKEKIAWVENLRVADILKYFRWSLVIHQVSDLYIEDEYLKDKRRLKWREKIIFERSDLTICVSDKLYKLKKNVCQNIHYLPHGVDFDIFQSAVVKNIKYEKIREIDRPIIGYFGTLTGNNDIELLIYCAKQLSDYHFVFAGQITVGDYSKLEELPNTKFLGKVPYENIPKLCANFDVCLLPWKMNKWIEHCNPLKLFEYMASGKPVVSVPIKEVEKHYSDVISIAYDKEEFCSKIEWELKNDNNERMRKRIKIAKNNSWDKKIDRLKNIIQNTLIKKSRRKGSICIESDERMNQ